MTIQQIENDLKEQFSQIDEISFFNQKKVIEAFRENRVSTNMFAGTTGYGYDDKGRDTLCKLFADVFGGEAGIVSPLLTCGTHTISTALFGLLRPGDYLLSITGDLYDTLEETLLGKGNGSLQDFGVKYEKVELDENEFDFDKIQKRVKKLKPKVVFIQRSRGYSARKALSVEQIGKACQFVKKNCPNCFVVVDNCYGEFVEKTEPTQHGADVIVGSLIKNAGGGLAPTGGYIVGTKKAIDLISKRFTCPSLGMEVGSFEMGYRLFYQGLFMAPHIVAQALKGSLLIGKVMEEKGYKTLPETDQPSSDIIRSIVMGNEQDLIKFVQTIQKFSPVDSFVTPMPWDMPGYDDQVIMAAGTFVGGASIEMSCDSPIRAPYIAYFQGALTYEHAKAVAEELNNLF